MKKKQHKTKVHPNILKLAKALGLKIKLGKSPKDVGIETDRDRAKDLGAFFPMHGVIFARSHSHFTPVEMNFVILHEIGHAIILHYMKDDVDLKTHEVSANAIAFAFCAAFNLPVTDRLVNNSISVTKRDLKEFKTIEVKK